MRHSPSLSTYNSVRELNIIWREEMVYREKLSSGWRLKGFKEDGEKEGAYKPDYNDKDWMKVNIPSEVHLELFKRGYIDDPFFHNNLDKLLWIPSWEWWYRLRFRLPSHVDYTKAFMVFHGLDTLAIAWLNGKIIGSFKNMFRTYKVDVTDVVLRDEENVLAIKFDSILKGYKATIRNWSEWREKEWLRFRPRFRKAQMSFGWDIAPKLLTIGIWKDVELLLVRNGIIEDVYVRTRRVKEKEAEVEVLVQITSYRDRESLVIAEVLDKGEIICSGKKTLKGKGTQLVEFTFRVRDAKLWWPWDVGEPYLYTLKVELLYDNEPEDERYIRFGIRGVKLITKNQQGRNTFRFVINDVPIYVRGINWTPPDAIFVRIDKDRYTKLLRMVKDMNANMLRIWGGGIYPHDIFYDLCDEMGIMIWQDFMFACADYPRDKEFLNEAREEAKDVVKRLRNHPSIILWCGDNECDAMFHPEGHPLNRVVLKQVCEELDPTRPYWPSSPCGGERPSSPYEGDTHIWHHGTYYKADIYERELEVALFISEIGHLSCPDMKTLRSYIPEERLWPPNEDYRFGYHPWSLRRLKRLERAMKIYWGELPKSIEEYIRVSQLLQAEAYKYWVEKCRRRKFNNGGIVLWNVTDCWPQCSDSIIDYFGRPKIAYYYVKIAFSPILVLAERREEDVVIWVVNDTLKSIRCILRIAHCKYPDEVKWKYESEISVPANDVIVAKRFSQSELKIVDRRKEYLLMELLSKDGITLSKNVCFLTETRELEFPPEYMIIRLVKS